jgi:predicted ATP-grasp superfamily ATP-dependent carboligase
MRSRKTAAGEVHVLIIDASLRQALVTLRELGKANLRVCAAERRAGAPAFASRWCTVSTVLPDFAQQRDAFVDTLLEVCAEYQPRALIPSHDGSIEALRSRRAEVERVVGLALGSDEAMAIAVDKARTLTVASDLGLRVPRGVLVGETTEARGALEEVGLPAVVKPTRSWVQENGCGQRLIPILATTRTAALAAIDAVLEEGLQAVVQEWLPGDREAVSFMYARGHMWARFAQRTTRSVPLLGGASVRRESIPLPADITRDAERLVLELDLEGYSEVEFRRDAEGRAALMEVNPRLSASVEVAVRAGVQFPRLLYDWASEGRLQEQPGYRSGVHMRWLGGDLSWLKKVWAQQGQPDTPSRRRAIGTFFADFLHPLNYDYVDVRDPRPTLHAAVGATRKAKRAKREVSHPQADRQQMGNEMNNERVGGR